MDGVGGRPSGARLIALFLCCCLAGEGSVEGVSGDDGGRGAALLARQFQKHSAEADARVPWYSLRAPDVEGPDVESGASRSLRSPSPSADSEIHFAREPVRRKPSKSF